MHIVLVMPSWHVEDVYPGKLARSMELFWPPVGLLYIGASLRKAGHTVSFVDGSFCSHREVLEETLRQNPRLVGIYGNTPLWRKTIRTLEDLKKSSPELTVAVGGPMPMAWKKRCYEDSPRMDLVCTCEGEDALPEVAAALESGASLATIPGILYREAGGEVRENPARPVIADLDALPFPAWDLLGDLRRYRATPGTYRQEPVGCVFSSRGCLNRCIFCFQYGPRRIRYRAAEKVVEEIRQLVSCYGVREIRFLDDNFTGDKARAFQLCGLMKKEVPGVTWYISDRVDGADPELYREMRRSGCWAVLFGAESGLQKNLDTLKKGVTVEQIVHAVKTAKRAGLKVYTPFIFGIPGETFADGLKTIAFARRLDPYYVNFHTITPYPGTVLYRQAERYGRISQDVEAFTFEHGAFVPHTMTREELVRLRSLAFRKFYGRPSYLWRRLLGIRSRGDVKAALKGAGSLFWLVVKRNTLTEVSPPNEQSRHARSFDG